MKLVITLDEKEVRELVAKHLQEQGYDVQPEQIEWTYEKDYDDTDLTGVRVELKGGPQQRAYD